MTGGIAFADDKEVLTRVSTGASLSQSKTLTGWTVGGGIEHAFTQNWIGRAEVRYADFGKSDYVLNNWRFKAGFHETIALVGVSYLFGSTPGAVVAKY